MMMALGMFVFSLETLSYEKFSRQTGWRHSPTQRIGTNPAHQFLGRDNDSLTLPGSLLAGTGGQPISLDVLRQMADSGRAWPLVEGTGRVYGLWVIDSLSDDRSLFFPDGAARRIDFSLKLTRIDDGRLDLLGAIAGSLGGLIRGRP
ncbi:phage tail protein [Pseudomonas sp. 5P_3.1_Bac2]|uniref:phage tail protein n=1 Tax=Pseudomonas sp. 5P_3.1_Bac2 TaxID=2971617 RepID=UPI0021C69F20|nr:phage tail protein [Pseudomonas sp. 5P_3.1_Bac2]MCU1717437.1 phage tail protein [Pseudomonas sp. 5P_3.1_Bac2]